MPCRSCMSALGAVTTFTVTDKYVYGGPGDTGLSAIVRDLNLCRMGPGNTLADWADCLRAAEQIAKYNGLAWDGPPNYAKPVLRVGQVIRIPSVEVTSIVPDGGPGPQPSFFSRYGKLLLLGGAGLVAVVYFGTRKKRKEK